MYNIRSKQYSGQTNGEKQDHISIPQTWNHNTKRSASKSKGIVRHLHRAIILEWKISKINREIACPSVNGTVLDADWPARKLIHMCDITPCRSKQTVDQSLPGVQTNTAWMFEYEKSFPI